MKGKELSMDKLSMLRCPTCKGRLDSKEALTCTKCQCTFHIKNGIPILLPASQMVEKEQDTVVEKEYYEAMFGGLRDLDGFVNKWVVGGSSKGYA
jgi:uncharacterized protein YbaR (Trm112 family)